MRNELIVLKQAKIQNAFGIKKSVINMELKNVQNHHLKDQIVKVGNDFFCMIPTFLGKNASGKTSLIKALDFAVNLVNKESFTKNLIIYANFIFRSKAFAIENKFSPIVIDSFLDSMFKQVTFAGSEKMVIELLFSHDNDVLIELSHQDFQIKINNQLISVVNILENIFKNDLQNKTIGEVENYFHYSIDGAILNYQFLKIKSDSLYRDTQHITRLNELLLKTNLNRFLIKLGNKFGSQELRFLLRKLDNKITNFEYDAESKSVSVYIKDTDGFPISPTNLSFGTIKTIEILAKSIDIWETGGLFFIDEIENGLHLSLIKLILAFYSNKQINSKQAQVILTTHNPLLFKENIIANDNAFLFEDNQFVNIKKHQAITRTENQRGFLDPKNYYNDYYWAARKTNNNTTISETAIKLIVNKFLEHQKNESRINQD